MSEIQENSLLTKPLLLTEDNLIDYFKALRRLNRNTNLEDWKLIILNARSIKYEVKINLFEKYPTTRLGQLRNHIINKNEIEIAKLCDNYTSDLSEFYFNKDPYILNMLLNYYQMEKMHLNRTECVSFICEELNYWQINEISFKSCCQIVYQDKLEDISELIEMENSLLKKIRHNDNFGQCGFPRLRQSLWTLFENPNSSIYAKVLFYISILIILLSNVDLGKKITSKFVDLISICFKI